GGEYPISNTEYPISKGNSQELGVRMGTGNSGNSGTGSKAGDRHLRQLPDKQSVHVVNSKNV
ncbi:MAG: hypothetical protein WCI51_17300, partial [Lentisphaerota bacterium]